MGADEPPWQLHPLCFDGMVYNHTKQDMSFQHTVTADYVYCCSAPCRTEAHHTHTLLRALITQAMPCCSNSY